VRFFTIHQLSANIYGPFPRHHALKDLLWQKIPRKLASCVYYIYRDLNKEADALAGEVLGPARLAMRVAVGEH
jgi:hypothetical protein